MKRSIACAVLFFAAFAACGATRQYWTVSVTNALYLTNDATLTNAITVQGNTRDWHTNVTVPATQIHATNDIGWARTNLLTHFATYGVTGISVQYGTNTNDVVFVGGINTNVTITLTGTNWGTVSGLTQQVAIGWTVTVPPANVTNLQTATNIASGIIDWIGVGSPKTTNAIEATAPAFIAFVQRTNGYSTNQVLQTPWMTNLNAFGGTATLATATITNANLLSVTMQGGSMTGASLTISGNGVNNLVSLVATTTLAAAGPGFSLERQHGYTNAQTSDVLGILGLSGQADTALKVAGRIRGYAVTNFTDANSPGMVTVEATPVGTTQPVAALRVYGDGVIVSNNLNVLSNTYLATATLTNVDVKAGTLTNVSLAVKNQTVTNQNVLAGTLTNVALAVSGITATNINAIAGTLTNVSLAIAGQTVTNENVLSATITNAAIAASGATITNLQALGGYDTNRMQDLCFSTNLTTKLTTTIAGPRYPRTDSAGLADADNPMVDVGNAGFIKFTGTVTSNAWINGFTNIASGVAGADGQEVRIVNATGQLVTLSTTRSSSMPEARILTPDGLDFFLTNNHACTIIYDTGSARWRVLSRNY